MIYVSVIHVSVSLSQYMCLCACLIWVISIAMFFLFPESFTESLLARHCQKTNLLIFGGSSFLFSITFDIFKLSFVFPYLIFLLRDVRFLMCLPGDVPSSFSFSSAGNPEPKKILLGRRVHQNNFL